MPWLGHLSVVVMVMMLHESEAQDLRHGTTVILVRNNDALFVGGDSFTSLKYYDSITKTTQVYNNLYCKLWHNGKSGLAVVGSFLDVNKDQGIKNLNLSLGSDSTIALHARYFKGVAEEAINRWKKYDQAKFNSIVQESTMCLSQVIYFGVEKDTLFSKRIIFRLLNPFEEHVIIDVMITNENIIAAGKIALIQDEVYNTQTWEDVSAIGSNIERLIKVEAEKFPEEVGGPVDIIVVRKNGSEWQKRKPICN